MLEHYVNLYADTDSFVNALYGFSPV